MKECLDDGRSFKNNMTSTYTLDYVLHNKNKDADRLKSYGNLSPSGLLTWQQCMAESSDQRCCFALLRKNQECKGKPSGALRTPIVDNSSKEKDRLNCNK